MWKSATRLLRIAYTVVRFRLDTFIPFSLLPWYIRYTIGLVCSPGRKSAEKNRGERLRLALESLGPIFVKFGQILSTRRDLLPDDIADELAKLQDRVPPFSGATAKKIIERSLGDSVENVFEAFSIEPLASASIAQVHTAKLKTGEDVVVKVIRPNIEKTIRQDIGLLYMLAHFVAKVSTDGRRLRPVEVVTDYEYTILDELDLAKEAANTGLLQRNFTDSPLLYVPQVHWDYCGKDVMVIERISGIPVADIEALNAANVNMKVLAERGVEIFFTQVFSHSFFHADMHPGNIFVDVSNPERPKYIAIDCAIMGSLDDEDKSYLARNLLAFFKRDYRMVAELHVQSGWVPKGTPIHAFESAIRSVCEPMFAKPLKDISFGQVLLGLFQTARRFNMEVQPQLVLLEKTLLNIEGLGRQLYPDLDLWVTAKPFLERWMSEQVGPRRVLDEVKKQAPEWAGQLPQIPNLVFSALTHLSHQEERMAEQTKAISALGKEIKKGRRNMPFKMLGLVSLAAAWITTDPIALEHLATADLLSLGLFFAGLYLLVLKP
ncbi:ubiquinone biosynthesis regulatory protein kinase UbiB [Marinomonas mediterranea]|jgi:2-octaprenylphenol hydroxylase (EC 1.14.13.-)|uniref:Probable protein kinase UbiB n=1 Tax=Marinomonas mediterranea (strain ATCC 700492 / JCM 21426 / NBRC 103028 / MMB-1) TaxID=717774 RepID=F2JTR8_MARM1|nr:ubiquinone biosynthesis regulatory protein kinase UbiB [Marinomonas mediterranea]ADZ92688.1 ubiquinone biosynthesis protein ubiB [Marinomonas mediterranea MMB-1]WCN10623.1 ubiquinone biosynthesis regulatory protein kinase UbiB [Marinomonas mediterranea]WCN14675.1 ubiquinone biosynthesis regulatory protein kinase UbiB [Marinomonas mediterranea]WCN18719.1 ubiquinone biosynthesis regulatory protein kinase UbiB [Marinomonas mediterranea MMB-1]